MTAFTGGTSDAHLETTSDGLTFTASTFTDSIGGDFYEAAPVAVTTPTCIIVSGNGIIRRSTDGGQTFGSRILVGGFNAANLTQIGLAIFAQRVNDNSTYVTLDEGVTWTSVILPSGVSLANGYTNRVGTWFFPNNALTLIYHTTDFSTFTAYTPAVGEYVPHGNVVYFDPTGAPITPPTPGSPPGPLGPGPGVQINQFVNEILVNNVATTATKAIVTQLVLEVLSPSTPFRITSGFV